MRRFGEASGLGLVGDVGGTHCRFALATRGDTELSAPVKYPCADFPDIIQAISAYLEKEAPRRPVEWAVIAVAGPVDRDTVQLTNHPWVISASEIAARLGMRDVRLVNDFTAAARATPLVEATDLIPLGGKPAQRSDSVTTAVVGAGTGLGVGGLLTNERGSFPLTTEGGHATFAPANDLEREIDRVLRTRFERVSAERLLSGDGLRNIYWALSQIDGVGPLEPEARDITRKASDNSDERAVRAVRVFCGVIGAFGGDVVLTMGARGGLYLSGGVIHNMLDVFDRAVFREAFEAKGRFRSYMEEIPAWIVVHPYAALLGGAALADDNSDTPAARVSGAAG